MAKVFSISLSYVISLTEIEHMSEGRRAQRRAYQVRRRQKMKANFDEEARTGEEVELTRAWEQRAFPFFCPNHPAGE